MRLSPMFFFQAEDGIRDDLVTGVQTCALPIYERRSPQSIESPQYEDGQCPRGHALNHTSEAASQAKRQIIVGLRCASESGNASGLLSTSRQDERSEERRVGKECRSGWWR